ncbi:MAG: pyridoxamine 5'-phosphate oxidase family protein [Acidimicrobiia bacterium]
MSSPTYDYVEAAIRKKTFGIYTTIDSQGRPHATGVLYGVSPPSSPLAIYILTQEHYVKVRNVLANPNSTLVIPFPHRILSFVPSNCVTLRGTSEIVPFSAPDGRWAFEQHRILRDNALWLEEAAPVFLKLVPEPKIRCYGLGISMMKLRSDHTDGGYNVFIPRESASPP